MSWPIRILRAFLGTTFVFAGIQKFLDPNFLRRGGGDYIGTQLAGFANATPAAPLMRILERAPMLTGVAIATLEIAIGLGTLLGIAMLSASLTGLAINVTLWLSATWHIHPYFLGSDLAYAVAWLALAVAFVEQERSTVGHVAGPIEHLDGISRREFARGSLVAGLAIALGVAAKAFAAPMSSSGLKGLGPQTRPSIGDGASPSATEGPVAAPSHGGPRAHVAPASPSRRSGRFHRSAGRPRRALASLERRGGRLWPDVHTRWLPRGVRPELRTARVPMSRRGVRSLQACGARRGTSTEAAPCHQGHRGRERPET